MSGAYSNSGLYWPLDYMTSGESSPQADYYIPEFLWNFWVNAGDGRHDISPFEQPHAGLHAFDTYTNELKTGVNKRPFSNGIFDGIKGAHPEITDCPEWERANAAFYSLEKDAETAIRCLLQQVNSRPRLPKVYSPGPAARLDRPKLSLGRHALQALQKYLIFLRFRNRDTYLNLLQRARLGALFVRDTSLRLYERQPRWPTLPHIDRTESLSDWVELLRSFTCYFTGNASEHKPISFIRECIHNRYESIQNAEICIGLAVEPDEFVLSPSCFGEVEGDNAEPCGGDAFHYFFSISPQVTIYLLIDAPFDNVPTKGQGFSHFLDSDAPLPPVIDHDIESPIDVYQRNALLLQTFPDFLYFVSARSMIRTVTYYNERRWLPENLDYSKLLRGCREESVTHMLLVRAKVDVVDLTDDVTKIGEYPVSYGSFADVWKAVWTDRSVWTDRVDRSGKGEKLVALKVLRATLVGYKQERLLELLKKEVKAWFPLEHPHVAKLYGVVQLPASLAMVSPWCENGTVIRYLRETNPGANRLQLLYEVSSGVAYLHSRSPIVVHGDLKGCNILIDGHGRAVIIDFGLSKVKGEISDIIDQPSSMLAGSTRWMAPELLITDLEDDRKPPISTYSDVYAFASVCLEVLTGQLPHPSRKNDHGVFIEVLNGVRPTNGLQFKVTCPKTQMLWDVMEECWDRIPRARPTMERICACFDQLRSS